MTLSRHSAPGTSAAFDFQFERALYWLSKSAAGFVIGSETDDDVSVRGPSHPALLEQDKHSIVDDSQPFGDRSKDLWNTLAIWVDALESGEIDAACSFLMVTNKTLPACIATQIGAANSDIEASACIDALEATASDPPAHIARLVERVLLATARQSLVKVIKNCDVIDDSKSAGGNALRSDTIANLQLPSWFAASADSILDELLGWLHKICLAKWQSGQPAWIRREHFVNQLHAILDRRKRQKSRERAEHLIPVPDESIGEAKASLFVKQIYLVADDNDIAETAIREFIRCSIEKTRLSAEGNVTDDDWTAFEDTLLSRWHKIRSRIVRTAKTASDEDIGFEIFTETTEEHRERLAGSETEQVYLTSGTYHRLANILSVGWHPRFMELLRKLKED